MRRMRKPRRPDVTSVELIGGAEALTMELHSYDQRWESFYLQHRRRIVDACTTGEISIHHIGSTSVPGLAAKPIIDIVVTVDDYLLLRDRLRSDAQDRALYENTKRILLSQQWDDMNDYADAKTDVIMAIKARARGSAANHK